MDKLLHKVLLSLYFTITTELIEYYSLKKSKLHLDINTILIRLANPRLNSKLGICTGTIVVKDVEPKFSVNSILYSKSPQPTDYILFTGLLCRVFVC